MRTKVEIEERMKHWEEQVVKCNDCLSEEEAYQKTAYARGASTLLAWVLEEPTYKRTIFELTKDELTKLISIISNDGERVIDKSIKENYNGWDCLEITDEDGDVYRIYENLDVSSLHVGYYNQTEFIDAIREMLSQEKPNV